MMPERLTNREVHQAPAYKNANTVSVNIVLEGGAMRGQFTAGVLDYFMDNGLWAEHVIGVSAGALCGYNYVAGETGRTCYLNLKYCNDWRYLSLQSFVRTGNALGMEYMFDEIPNRLDPFDYDTFRASPVKLTTVATNLDTGDPDYFTFGDPKDDLMYLAASSAMPLVSKTIKLDGKLLLDGGVSDSVPIEHSFATGAKKHIVVLTQDASFVKTPNRIGPLARQIYSDFPHFVERIQYRHVDYNRVYRLVKSLDDEEEIFVIRPPQPVTVSNMEKDENKLFNLYQLGYIEAATHWNDLINYLAK